MADENDLSNIKTVASTQAAGSTPDTGQSHANTGSLLDRYLGTTVAGRYVIEKELGRGGIGVVYLAKDQQLLSKRVVIKVLLDDTGQDEWVRNKFRQEIEALTRIDHPGVIGALDTGQMPDGKPYFVMQFVEGVNLRTVMKPEGMDVERVANIVKQLGSALTAAHEKGVFHRDLKPENVMLQILEREERVKLIDFGIAKVKDSQDGQSTKVPMIAGTFNYMAPEQLTGDPVTAASDTYAFAIMAYEMITGRRPFVTEAKSAAALLVQLLEQQRSGPRLKPKELRPSISEEAQEIIMRALSYESDLRPARALDFGDELSAALLASPKSSARPITALTNPPVSPHSVPTNINGVAVTSANQSDQAGNQRVDRAATNVQGVNDFAQTSLDSGKKSNVGIIGALVAVALLIVVGIVAIPRFMKQEEPVVLPTGGITKGPGGPTTNPTVDGTERQLTYWVIVQRYRDGKPYKEPYRLSKEVVFEEGDRVKFFFTSPQPGHFYIVNEGPAGKDGNPTSWSTLFPNKFTNNGNSALTANTELQIPGSGDGFQFDAQTGTEKLWIIWSEQKVEELEVLQKWYNEKDKGEIKDPAQAKAAQQFITDHNVPARIERDDDVKKQTAVKGNGKVLISLIKLEHQ